MDDEERDGLGLLSDFYLAEFTKPYHFQDRVLGATSGPKGGDNLGFLGEENWGADTDLGGNKCRWKLKAKDG